MRPQLRVKPASDPHQHWRFCGFSPATPKAPLLFHIAQLSDIHIGPFTTADYIRRCVAMTNGLEPDLIALTGDYISWDPEAQGEVVRVLAGLRAPHGVFGCMGNHEADVGIEESITRLFAAQGIRMLRQESAPIRPRIDTGVSADFRLQPQKPRFCTWVSGLAGLRSR